MTFKAQCPSCGQVSYGWGNRCICGLPIHFDMASPVVKLKHYGDVHTGRTVWENMPDHDLEYHDKKLEGR